VTTSAPVSVLGLGKLGACVAAALALRGRTVIGVDVRPEIVDSLNEGRVSLVEPGLQEAVSGGRSRLCATTDVGAAIRNSDVTFVVVPTPSQPDGAFSLDIAKKAFAEIGRALKEKDTWHLVVLTSTVLPGMTRHGLIPVLEETSGKRCGVDFGVCYSPAFIALGSVIRDFLNPDVVIVGESDPRAGETLEALYADVLENDAPVRRMSLENGELAKIGVNTFVTTKIAFANMIADLCERIPGGDVDVVTDTLGLDRRIGRAYLTGGLGYGGPCFPRDNQALSHLARALGTSAPIAEATDRVNQEVPARIISRLKQAAAEGKRISVLGLSYKPGTSVIEASQGIWLARALARAGARVTAYDPLAGLEALRELGSEAAVAATLEDALAQAEVVLVCAPDPEFRSLTAEAFTRATDAQPIVVFDCWRVLSSQLNGRKGIHYIAAGRFTNDPGAVEHLAHLWGEHPEEPAVIRGNGGHNHIPAAGATA